MSDEVKLLPCDRCGGKRTVRDIKPGVDWLRVYPEQMPCPECTDGTWADADTRAIEATRPTDTTDFERNPALVNGINLRCCRPSGFDPA